MEFLFGATIVVCIVLMLGLVSARRELARLREADRQNSTILRELKSAEVRLHHLVEATRVLSSSLNLDSMMQELARFLAKAFGESCVIYIKDETLRRAAEAIGGTGGSAEDISQTPQMRTVLHRGRSEVIPHRGIIVPMPSRGCIAAAFFLSTTKPAALERDDVHLLEEIGRRAGISIENARLYAQTQTASRQKDEFVAALSHELRTPLTPILGAVYMLKSEPYDRRIFNKALDLIERNAKWQAKIVEDLLDISRIISGTLRIRQEPVDIESAIETALESVRPASEAKRIDIRVSVNPLNGVVHGDAVRLQQVFANLLSNSVKFTSNGGRITIELLQGGDNAEVRVTDTGKGIAEEFLPFVFDRFRQEDSSRTRMHGGLGIGLAIVRHLVESHGGTVQAHSLGDQKGSTFVVRLPLHVGRLATESRTRTASHS